MDTRPERKGEELHRANLHKFLYEKDLLPALDSSLEISQFKGGYSNLTYLLKTADKEYVLRRPPKGSHVKKGHDMGREYKVLSRLYEVFPKAPRAYIYSDDDSILGAPFYLMECVSGIILRRKEVISRKIDPETFKTIADSWLDTLVELHQVDYTAAALADLGRPEGYVERQVKIWSRQYLKAATSEIPEAEKAMSWMQENQPVDYGHCLIHNDYKYDNIVFAADNWKKVIAVLDWEMTTIGDPWMDLGTSLGYWILDSDPEIMRQGLDVPTAFPGNPGRAEIAEAYATKSGRPLRHLVFYYVFGLFKIAVIAQQIFYRYKQGFTQDPRFAHLDKVAVTFCKTAWQAIQKQRIDNL